MNNIINSNDTQGAFLDASELLENAARDLSMSLIGNSPNKSRIELNIYSIEKAYRLVKFVKLIHNDIVDRENEAKEKAKEEESTERHAPYTTPDDEDELTQSF